MRDICTRLEGKADHGEINFSLFVYEMELHKLPQPFFQSSYYLYLFVCGEGEVMLSEKSYAVRPGTLVLVHPWQMLHIKETKHELTYLYIAFSGDGVAAILPSIGAEAPITVYPGYEHLLDFWMKSIRRIRESNAVYVTQSVFSYTVSYLLAKDEGTDGSSFDAIKNYVQENLADPELSLRAVAGIFFYSEKYFSYLFREKTGIRFTDYLNDLRIHYALRLMDEGTVSVGALSAACGFMNAGYFSKVFKKIMGKSPAAYIRDHNDKSI